MQQLRTHYTAGVLTNVSIYTWIWFCCFDRVNFCRREQYIKKLSHGKYVQVQYWLVIRLVFNGGKSRQEQRALGITEKFKKIYIELLFLFSNEYYYKDFFYYLLNVCLQCYYIEIHSELLLPQG